MMNIKPLGEVVKLRKGKKAVEVHNRRVNDSKPYIQIDEVRGSLPEKFASDPKGIEVNANDLCIVWDGANAGTVGYGIDGLIGSTIARMRVVQPDKWDTRFIGRLLQSKFQELNEQARGRGATIPHINKAKLEEISLPLIAKEEQRRIAAILDKADSIRREQEETIAMVDTFLHTAFLDRFGHPLNPNGQLESSKLGVHCDFFAGNSLPTGEDFTGQDGGLFLLKVSDLSSPGNEVVIKSAKLWAPSKIAVRGGVVAPSGSVVFPKRGGAIATNKKRILERDSVLDPNLMAVVPKPDSVISKEYLHVWFGLINLETISSGSSIPQLNKKDLAPLAFGVPKKGSVEWFSNVYEFVRGLKDSLYSAFVEVDALFSSLSQRAFHGKL